MRLLKFQDKYLLRVNPGHEYGWGFKSQLMEMDLNFEFDKLDIPYKKRLAK